MSCLKNKNLKNFVGEYAYNIIKNIVVDNEAVRRALVTPQNARNVFSELSEYEVKSLCFEISSSATIGKIRETTQEEIKDAFNSIGYDTVIFDDESAILECKKYYCQSEIICTYNSLKSRMRDYHMLVAVKKDIDKIERSNKPQRDDEYGTSILNIQIARNGSHMSIKNRYNHTVSQPDSTLNNNLDLLYVGLQSMVLGYYGFASLSKQKSCYRNVVNIGEIYLKYHTEKNNIYYGAFVLDGVNGARYTDTSRYYVTSSADKDSYHIYPLILDFKDKSAIDACGQMGKNNGRATLLTRAMRSGMLTSANKSESNTISAIFQDTRRELLQCRKKALQYIHEVFGYDFTKPYKVTGILGNFTAKSIEKATGSDSGILLVYARGEIRVCKMMCGDFYTKNENHLYAYGIDKFYTKGNFEEVRKSGNAATFVIQQEKQYIGKPKIKKEIREVRMSNIIYDKGGCNLTETRNALGMRLVQYKADKRAKEAAGVDYTKDILEIEYLFSTFKANAMDCLSRAETYDDYMFFKNNFDYNVCWMVSDIEIVKRQYLDKNFKSIKDAQQKIDKIKNTLTEKINKITKKEML